MMARGTTRAGRTLRRYATAVATNGRGRPLGYPRTLLRLLAARMRHGIGPLLYSLYGLDRKPMADWGTYLVDKPGKPLYEDVNPRERREALNDKLLFHAQCVRHALATAPIVALVPGADLRDAHGVPAIAGPAHLAQLVAAHPQGLFAKQAYGSHGEGAFRILPDAGGCLLPTGPASLADAYAYCAAQAREHTLIVQPRLVNAANLRPLMAAGGFGTVRAMTWLDGGTPRLLAALLRIVAGDNVADNFNAGTSGNLLAPIDVDRGTIACVRRSRSRDWPDIVVDERHPAAGLPLPHWPAVLDLVARAHRTFDGLRLIGWDVGITDDGPLLVEGNGTPDWDLMQIAFDRGFRPDFERVAGRRLAAAWR